MKENKAALDHVRSIIENLGQAVPTEIVFKDVEYVSFTYRVKVAVGNDLQVITLDRGIIDDLEVAFESYSGTSYFDTLDSSIKFTIYISLGQAGVLSDFLISNEMINENRAWIKDYRINTRFGKKITEVFYDGLQMLSEFFNLQIKEHKKMKLSTTEIDEHTEWVNNLIEYYVKHQNLDSTGVGIENLQYLKAAAIRQIIELEDIREKEKRPTTWRALNDKIYEIVGELRIDPFLDIEPPSFIHDVVADLR